MKYRIEIEGAEFPGYQVINTEDEAEVDRLRRVACENAKRVKPQWEADRDGEHLVYYYEEKSQGNRKDVHVLMRPRAVKDNDFQNYVDIFQPDYVGAIHRRI